MAMHYNLMAIIAAAPAFLGQGQVLAIVAVVLVIGLAIGFWLPRLFLRAPPKVQTYAPNKSAGNQESLSGLMKELNGLPTDQLLNTLAARLRSHMQVSRVLVLMQDPMSGEHRLQAQDGAGLRDASNAPALREDAAVVKWLGGNRESLIRQEIKRRVPAAWLQQHLEAELNQLNVAACVPMVLDGRLAGLIGLGEKLNHDAFSVSDLRPVETIAIETALAVKYHHMEDEVFRKNRLVELGTIAAGVAHEIRNPLASIKTFAQLMPERMDDPEFKNEFSKLVLKDVDRITKVIESMLAFARPGQVSVREQSTNELVEEAILLIQPRLKAKHVELTRAFQGNPVVKVDKQQMLQVLVNLLSNAVDAVDGKGNIRVATGVSQFETKTFAVIEVSDSGPGISAAVRSRLFDPFFTTKKEGTGLGLSISQKIARDHGGTITVSSVEGKGTTFQINLPVK